MRGRRDLHAPPLAGRRCDRRTAVLALFVVAVVDRAMPRVDLERLDMAGAVAAFLLPARPLIKL